MDGTDSFSTVRSADWTESLLGKFGIQTTILRLIYGWNSLSTSLDWTESWLDKFGIQTTRLRLRWMGRQP
jgi:hypothetical protein